MNMRVREEFRSKSRIVAAIAIGVISVIARFFGYEQSLPNPNPSYFPFVLQLSSGFSAPAALITRGALNLFEQLGTGGYQYLDYILFFLATMMLWLWLPIWIVKLVLRDARPVVFLWTSIALSLLFGGFILFLHVGIAQNGSIFKEGRALLDVMQLIWAFLLIGSAIIGTATQISGRGRVG